MFLDFLFYLNNYKFWLLISINQKHLFIYDFELIVIEFTIMFFIIYLEYVNFSIYSCILWNLKIYCFVGAMLILSVTSAKSTENVLKTQVEPYLNLIGLR